MTSPILAYSDPDKQLYLFTDSSKHSWSGILGWYAEQEQEYGTKLNIPPAYYISKWNLSGFTEKLEHINKDAYAISMSFQKWSPI